MPNKSSDTEDFDLRWNYFQLMLESLYSSYINLMQYHSKHHVYPLHKMRLPLNDAVKLFPDHHCFTHTFVKITSAANIAGLMWRQISSVIRLSNTSALWLELLLAEFKRKDNLAKFMQQSKELFGRDSSSEYIFLIEIINDSRNNIIVMLLYRFPKTSITSFTSSLQVVLEELIKQRT